MRQIHDNDEDTVTITARVTQETARALCVLVSEKRGVSEVKWVPKSVIHDDSEVFDKTHTTPAKLVVLGWWARKEGLG